MIISVEQIHVPESGKYREAIYDIQSSWNSQKWTWLKFTNDDYNEWCGEFRGELRNFAISDKSDYLIVLTSDYMYQLDRESGNMIDFVDSSEYIDVTASPNGKYIVTDDIRSSEVITLPIHLEMISFCFWDKNELTIEAVEFCNWDNNIVLSLNIVILNVDI